MKHTHAGISTFRLEHIRSMFFNVLQKLPLHKDIVCFYRIFEVCMMEERRNVPRFSLLESDVDTFQDRFWL